MQINLRRAAALQTAILETVKGLDFGFKATVNEFQDPEQEIQRVATVFNTNLVRRDALMSTLYEIRSAVDNANHGAGISVKLAAIARLEKDIQFYSTFVSEPVREDHRVIQGKLEKIRNDKGDRIYRSDTVETTVFVDSMLEDIRQTLSAAKKAKQKLQDELLEANVRTQVQLSDVARVVLEQEKLI